MLALLLALSACSNPCHEYCESFVNRTGECGLGGPSGDSAIDECADGVDDVLTDDACETADDAISQMGCSEFSTLVCSDPNADLIYDCS